LLKQEFAECQSFLWCTFYAERVQRTVILKLISSQVKVDSKLISSQVKVL